MSYWVRLNIGKQITNIISFSLSSFFQMELPKLSLCLCLCILGFSTNLFSAYTKKLEDVQNLPFLSLYESPKRLHLIKDYFTLVQHIDLKNIIDHINSIAKGFKTVKTKFLSFNDTHPHFQADLEEKLIFSLEQIAEVIETGIEFLPQARECSNRGKRDLGKLSERRIKRFLDMDTADGPVNTRALFPSVGRLFSWITGSLDVDAGTIINQNFDNIKKLTKVSRRFAEMFNATLNIQKKQAKQIQLIKQQIVQTEAKLGAEIGVINRISVYQSFLESTILVILDIKHTVDYIFQQTDAIESNKIGPLARDKSFIKSIIKLMDYDYRHKPNSLHLMKISAKTDIEICHWAITVVYKFPILEQTEFKPYKTINIPKIIKGKYFELVDLPYLITWSSSVYTFTQKEYEKCDHHTRHMFCRIPTHVQSLLENCIYGLVSKWDWGKLVNSCPVRQVKNPKDLIMFTQTHLFFFLKNDLYSSIICANYSKTLLLRGSGSVTIPTGCKLRYGNTETFSMGHITRSADITLDVDTKIWFTNISHIASMLKVENVKNASTLWEDLKEDEQVMENGIKETIGLLDKIKLNPEVTTVTLWSLMLMSGVTSLLLVMLIMFVCVPGLLMSFKRRCCCCNKTIVKEREVRSEEY